MSTPPAEAPDGINSNSSIYGHADESDCNIRLPDTLPKDIDAHKVLL